MKKANRVVDNKDFSLVIKTGSFVKNNTYRVFYKKQDLGYVRVGIAASTKLGNAVIRTTTKRKIRAICDLLLDYQNNSFDIIIIPKINFIDQEYAFNRDALNELFSKFIGTKK